MFQWFATRVPFVTSECRLLPSQEKHALINLSCLQDIVGPRFHCAVCPSWDLCIQCEGIHMAGGDGSGHLSDHIMMKVCVFGILGTLTKKLTQMSDSRPPPDIRGRGCISACTRPMVPARSYSSHIWGRSVNLFSITALPFSLLVSHRG